MQLRDNMLSTVFGKAMITHMGLRATPAAGGFRPAVLAGGGLAPGHIRSLVPWARGAGEVTGIEEDNVVTDGDRYRDLPVGHARTPACQ